MAVVPMPSNACVTAAAVGMPIDADVTMDKRKTNAPANSARRDLVGMNCNLWVWMDVEPADRCRFCVIGAERVNDNDAKNAYGRPRDLTCHISLLESPQEAVVMVMRSGFGVLRLESEGRVASGPGRNRLRLAASSGVLQGPEKYRILDLKRRRAQIRARRALGLIG